MLDFIFEIDCNEYLPLRDVVFRTLRDAILTGKLVPGERLMENQLADKLGVSRTPIREALRMLSQENLVELVPRKGAQVLDITEKDIVDVLEIRGALEGLAAALASQKMERGQLAQLKQAEETFENACEQGDIEAMVDSDEKFHELIFAATGNEKLIQMFHHLRTQLYRYRMAHIKMEGSKNSIITHHRGIIAAIEAKDAAQGERQAKEHISYHAAFILHSLKK